MGTVACFITADGCQKFQYIDEIRPYIAFAVAKRLAAFPILDFGAYRQSLVVRRDYDYWGPDVNGVPTYRERF